MPASASSLDSLADKTALIAFLEELKRASQDKELVAKANAERKGFKIQPKIKRKIKTSKKSKLGTRLTKESKPCRAVECKNKAVCKGLCRPHYDKIRHGKLHQFFKSMEPIAFHSSKKRGGRLWKPSAAPK